MCNPYVTVFTSFLELFCSLSKGVVICRDGKNLAIERDIKTLNN